MLFLSVLYFLLFVEMLRAQAPDWLWARTSAGMVKPSSTAVDDYGNTYVTGWYDGTITFDTITLTNAGQSDMFLVKYDLYGNVLWARRAGGPKSEIAQSVAVSASGSVYVSGYFYSDSVNFDTFTLLNAGSSDIFLVKYDANGNVTWAKNEGGSFKDRSYSVATDAVGNTWMTGYFESDSLTIGPYTMVNKGFCDIFLVKYDNNGNILWAKSAGGTDLDEAVSVAIDGNGNAYIAGDFSSDSIAFGPYTCTNPGFAFFTPDIFLAKYDALGNELWVSSAGGLAMDEANGVGVDGLGNPYLTGGFGSDTLSFGPFNLIKTGSYDIFLTKFNTNGNVLWAKSIGGPDWDIAYSVAVHPSGYTLITGCYFSSTVSFDTIVLLNSDILGGDPDIFLAEYDMGGNVIWAKSAGGGNDDEANAVGVNAPGAVRVTGFFYSDTIIFDTIEMHGAGSNMFIAAIDDVSLGVPEVKHPVSLSVFPNPATDYVNLNIPEKAVVEIYDSEGRCLKKVIAGNQLTTLDLQGLTPGFYCIMVKVGNRIEVKKLIRQ